MGVLYRRESLDLLCRSVTSILEQSFREFEFLICDDGSTHAAQELLEHFRMLDDRIRLIRPGGKLDLASKLNACLKAADGGYIARMDDDDYSHPDRFQKQLELLRKDPDLAFVGSNVNLCRECRIVGNRVFPQEPQVKDFYFSQPFIHPALMFRREALEAVGGYSENKRQVLCEDYDLLLRLYAKGFRGRNIGEFLLDYSLPATAGGNRKMRHRWNEAATRFERFRELGILPKAMPYVIKPLAAGLIPARLRERMKQL